MMFRLSRDQIRSSAAGPARFHWIHRASYKQPPPLDRSSLSMWQSWNLAPSLELSAVLQVYLDTPPLTPSGGI
jgi:hypothetical protein